MKIEFIKPEPLLEFGNGGKCQDMKFGIGHFGVFDLTDRDAPTEIKLGFVGSSETITSLIDWFEKCQQEIPAKPSKQPNLYPPFPGFSFGHSFHSKLTWNTSEFRAVDIPDEVAKLDNLNEVIEKVVDLYILEITSLLEKTDAK